MPTDSKLTLVTKINQYKPLCQLLKFPPRRLLEPVLRTAAAIRCLLSSTLPARDFLPASREPESGL